MKNITLLSVLIALTVLVGTTVKGEVQYTNIEPDITFPTDEQNESHAVDLGFQDGDEIEISTTTFTLFDIPPSITFSGENGTTFSGDGDISEAIVDANTVIGPDLTFSQNSLTFDNPGNFPVQNQDYYLAVRVESNSEYYYGWIRIAQISDSEWTIKDFSMQDSPGTTITPDGTNPDPGTGGGGNDEPGEIGDFAISKVEDVAETHSGADIEVSFNGAADETGILHYRIIVAPESMKESLTPEQAILLNPTRYHAVQPGQETYTTTLPSDQKDAEGSDIANKVSYVVFIFAVAEQGSEIEMADKLSAPSSPITLRTLCQGPDEIRVRSLKSDDSEGPIELSFSYLENQEKNLEFRVFAIHNDDRNEFTLEIAENIPAENYQAFDPNTTENIFQLSLSNDINGNPIDAQGFYKYAVLAVQDVVNTDISKLSQLSNPVAISPDGFIHAGETLEELKSLQLEQSITFERSQFNKSIEIDVDEDGQSDLKITVNVSSDQSDNSREITIVSLGAYEVSTYPQRVLDEGDQISDLCSYTRNKLELLNISGNEEFDGPWNNQQEKFLAIRKNSFQEKQLGWLKITTDNEKLTVHTSEVEKSKVVTGNDEISSGEVNIFPSPASEIIYLSGLQTISGATSIRIVDISGKEVMSIQEDALALESDGINIEDLKQGIYIIEVGSNNERIVTKFIKN